MTAYSTKEVAKYGHGLNQTIIGLSLKIDALKSLQDRLPREPTWAKQRHWHYQKRIHKLSNRVEDLVSDLHRRVAYDLVTNYDVIFLPTFKTKEMSKKIGRKIRKVVVRAMERFRFYEFSTTLAWMCKKYGKTLLRVNESYTSKTDSRTGRIVNIGGAKTVNGLDRDINGARGILLRALTRAA